MRRSIRSELSDADFLPDHPEDVKALFSRERYSLTEEEIQKIMEIVKKYIPWKTKCLDQALTGKILFKIFNIPTRLYIGKNKEKDEFEAHAWLKYEEYFITEEIEESQYSTIATF